jgi:hypothetical protein
MMLTSAGLMVVMSVLGVAFVVLAIDAVVGSARSE